jgi:hypothetical protein|tara:strand:- start:1480 stop:1632 length:153 start_codon:yes stop_codon:yes gene_type:complete
MPPPAPEAIEFKYELLAASLKLLSLKQYPAPGDIGYARARRPPGLIMLGG